MRYILPLIIIAAMIFTGCSTSETPAVDDTESTLLGKWELSKEIVNKKTLDFGAEKIKTLLSFEKEAYFVYFDDLSNSGLADKVAKIQTHYQGQYELDGKKLVLTYTNNAEDFTDEYTIKLMTNTELVIVNKKSSKESHYIKR